MSYDYSRIEEKWQKIWESENTFAAGQDKEKPKFFALVEFPYPSGQGLHVGHPRSYTAMDILARKRRMDGYNVLYPMGWDAFGLPTENFAIKNKIHPRIVTEKNVDNFKRQLKSLGFSFDWTREINTTDPDYYKWTQWIFLKLFEKGLAYKQEMPINWCTGCKVGLANEEVVGGVCERCGSEVVQKQKSQWMLKITDYAERLAEDVEATEFLEKIKTQQKNWIGRSEGAEVKFSVDGSDDTILVYTTRPDTLFGATYVVLSPEHALVLKLKDKIENYDEVCAYAQEAAKKTEFERTELVKDKTGVELKGIKAVNPVNGEKVPVWISDYVLTTYGTGAIMAVPAHDTRDHEFAKKFGLPIIEVVAGGKDVQQEAFTDVSKGNLINSGFLTGKSVGEAIPAMIDWLEEKGLGNRKVNFKLRDWVFSRQRYWGEPIPLVWCEKCGWVSIGEENLPLTLPDTENFEPGEGGESPLSKMTDWVNTTCPKCGGKATRETDTMPQWAGSSWYFLRYTDANNSQALASKENLDYWLPVDWYNGGMEHTTLHLLYSRFWHKFLYDIGVVPTSEPYHKRTSHGMILGENGEKMSKSRGNVINPDDIVNEYGADTFRTYEMFIGAFDQATPWSMQGVKGCYRFMERVWALQFMLTEEEGYSPELESAMHKAIKKVGEDIERMKFNTAIATLMALVNDFNKQGKITRGEFKTFLQLLNPTAPHITEELWEMAGFEGTIAYRKWPEYDSAKTVDDEIEIVLQVNGKIAQKMNIPSGLDRAAMEELIVSSGKAAELAAGKTVVKIICVPGKLVNLVVK